MATNHVGKIKDRAREVITQPDSIPTILDIPPPDHTFQYPKVDADMTEEQRRRAFAKMEQIAEAESLDLLARVMVHR
jgi:hypothetical protein